MLGQRAPARIWDGGVLTDKLKLIHVMADEKIIFSMNGVGKILPHNNRVILKDIYLSFFYGAKIGIIGLNGSGKSTLMKIIAGIETGYQGEVVWAPGYSVGYLEQEPQMDPDKTVLEVVQEGVQEVMDILKEYEEVNLRFCEPMSDDEMAALIERQGELTEKIENCGGWEIDSAGACNGCIAVSTVRCQGRDSQWRREEACGPMPSLAQAA